MPFASFKEILSCGGENRYSHHTGSRTAHAQSERQGNKHDRSFPCQDVKKAATLRDSLSESLERAMHPASDSSTSESDEPNCDGQRQLIQPSAVFSVP